MLYRPPNSAPSTFIADFSTLLANLAHIAGPLMIVGDFNINIDDRNSPLTKTFIQLLDEYGMTQHVNTPTHKNGHTLDLFITKNLADISPGIKVIDPQISDHSVVATVYVVQPQRITSLDGISTDSHPK